MLIKQQAGPNGSSGPGGSSAIDKTYKRSHSLLGESKSKFGPPKRTGTLDDNNNARKKTAKNS